MSDNKIAAIFPGQGSQSVGMGAELAAAFAIVRDTFTEANAVLGFDIADICFHGPAEELKRTSLAQPALLTMSVACWRLLQEGDFHCDIVAGHSLGEYSALVASGAIGFANALQLVQQRGTLMEQAAAEHPGSMAAVLSLSDEQVEDLCREVSQDDEIVVPANYNSPGQVVVSGTSAAVAALRAAAKAQGGRAIPLPVSGPFHSPLMRSASDAYSVHLDTLEMLPPLLPVVPNVTALVTNDIDAIRAALAAQITGSVQWVNTLKTLRDFGVTKFVEVGPGAVLSGLVQRTLPDCETQIFDEVVVSLNIK